MGIGHPKGLVGKKYDYLELDEVKRFIAAIPEEATAHRLIFTLLARCGLRVGEITGEERTYRLKSGEERTSIIPPLRVSDVSMALKVLKIQGKGSKARLVTFETEPEVELALRRHLETAKPTDLLVVQEDGAPFSPLSLWRLTQRYAALASFTRPRVGPGCVHPHIFRHTYATWMAYAGADPYWLMGQLGHSNITTTMVYVNRAKAIRATKEGRVPKLEY